MFILRLKNRSGSTSIQVMNKIIFLPLCIVIFNTLGFSQQVKDIDGNIYTTIKIKDQLWFESNLKTTRFINGDKILKTKKASKWVNHVLSVK